MGDMDSIYVCDNSDALIHLLRICTKDGELMRPVCFDFRKLSYIYIYIYIYMSVY